VAELVLERPVGARPFDFVAAEHPLRADVERFWALAEAATPSLAALAAGGCTRRSVLRLYPGTRRLKRLTVSFQSEAGGAFSSVTYHYRARKRRLSVLALHDDPLLVSLASLAPEVERVLQYVPRHRFAFLAARRGGGREVAKCVRPTDLDGAWRRLCAVWDAARRARPSFLVAEPRGVDPGRGVFYQSELPGRDVALRLDASSYRTLLGRAGATHAELQSLDVRGLPVRRPSDLLPQLGEHAELVTLFRPDALGLVNRTYELLRGCVPEDGPPAFCHGDLRCGHLLEHEGLWSVIDLDGCALGDPAADVARLLAFLKRDVPFLRDRFAAPDGGHDELDAATEAFLAGHAERARRPLEPGRLAWYLLAHELHFLARMFKRDLYDPLAFERGAERVARLGERVREHLCGGRRP
jgi:hypothetical protein